MQGGVVHTAPLTALSQLGGSTRNKKFAPPTPTCEGAVTNSNFLKMHHPPLDSEWTRD